MVTNQLGTVNNIIQVKTTDFEVFDALMVDSQKCSDMSGVTSTKWIKMLNLQQCILRFKIICRMLWRHVSVDIRPLQLSSWTVSSGRLRTQTRREIQISSDSATSSPTGHPQQGHRHLGEDLHKIIWFLISVSLICVTWLSCTSIISSYFCNCVFLLCETVRCWLNSVLSI